MDAPSLGTGAQRNLCGPNEAMSVTCGTGIPGRVIGELEEVGEPA